MRKALLFFFIPVALSAAGPAARLQEKARAAGLAADPHWIRLLHVRRGFFGFKSQADGPDFFLSPRGRKDPAAELEATLAAFFVPAPEDPEKQSPQCRFPARYQWLREKLGGEPDFPPPQACPRLEAWLSRMDAGGLTLLYASSYMNNPASMYGHTFFRIDPAGSRAASPLLAYSINFAAQTPETNGILFAAKGLAGGYRGLFATHPFYMKVQEYTNMESRDLWEYRLHLSSEAVGTVMLHLWEMGNTWFDYYFFTENCSYQLLPLLEAADPALELSGRFHAKAIPVDTLRAVIRSPGLLRERRLRPSAVRVLLARRSLLAPAEVRVAERAARFPREAGGLVAPFPPERQVLILDSAYDLMRYRHHFVRYPTATQEAGEQELLARRGKIPLPSPEVSAASEAGASPPEDGHPTGRVGIGGGRSGGRGFTEISLRGAMQDLEEDPAGFVPGSRLEMIHLRLRYFDAPRRLVVHRATLVDIESLTPLDRWLHCPSWKFAMGWDTPLDRPVKPGSGVLFRLNGGSGLSWGGEKLLFYGLAGLDGGLGGALPQNYRIGWETEGGFLCRPARAWGLHGTVFRRRYFLGEPRTVDGARAVLSWRWADLWEARATATREGKRREGQLMLQRYL